MRKTFSWLLNLGIIAALCFLALVIFFGDEYKLGRSLVIDQLQFPIVILDRHGEEIFRQFDRENRDWIPLEAISPDLIRATIVTEDQRFYDHRGVDFWGVTRAMHVNLRAGYFRQGASTLTQQLGRKLFLSDEKTITRKFKEWAVALGIESRYSKSEILEMYLNTVPYGPRTNGVLVASREYFGKHPRHLTEAEALVLASLPKDPVRLSRQTIIQDQLGQCTDWCEGFWSESYEPSRLERLLVSLSRDQNWDQDRQERIWDDLQNVQLLPRRRTSESVFQHWRFYILDWLAQNVEPEILSRGITVQTTLDARLQRQMYEDLRRQSGALLESANMENQAVIALENQTAAPLIWIGSKAFWNEDIEGQVDVLRSPRQTGSAIKPLIYAAAIEAGYEPPTFFHDLPLRFRDSSFRPNNSDGRFLGVMTMTQSLAWSRNIPAIKAFYLAGGERKVRNFLENSFAIPVNTNYRQHRFGWSIALGTIPIKPSELALSYSWLATHQASELCPVIQLKDPQGNIQKTPCRAPVKLDLKPTTTNQVALMMSNQKKRPQAWHNDLLGTSPNWALKTGTSSKRVSGELRPVDNLIVGFSPDHTLLVWGGNTDGRALASGKVAVETIATLWRDLKIRFETRYPTTVFFVPDPSLRQIRGEWATLGYEPKPYPNNLTKAIRSWEPGNQYWNPVKPEASDTSQSQISERDTTRRWDRP